MKHKSDGGYALGQPSYLHSLAAPVVSPAYSSLACPPDSTRLHLQSSHQQPQYTNTSCLYAAVLAIFVGKCYCVI